MRPERRQENTIEVICEFHHFFQKPSQLPAQLVAVYPHTMPVVHLTNP